MDGLRADEYQVRAMETAIYPDWCRVVYPTLGLLGEASEVAEKVRNAVFPEGREPLDRAQRHLWDVLTDAIQSGRNAEILKKVFRDTGDAVNESFAKDIQERVQRFLVDGAQVSQVKKEVAGGQWYTAASCRDLGVMMSEMMEGGLAQLASRKARGTLKGSGDDR